MKPHHVFHLMTGLMCVVLLCSACAGLPGRPRPASNRVEEHYHRGQASAEMGDYDQAIAEFSQALIRNPNFAEAYWSRGVAYALKGDHDRAIQNYDEALALNSNLSLVRYQLAQSWLHKQEYDKAWRAVQCYRQAGGIPEPAFIEKLRQASGRQEDDHYNHGLTRMWCQGDLDGAIADFTKALEHNPRDASAYMNRGTARSARGDQDGAIADTTKALEHNPRDADAYYNRGLARGNKGDRDEAIKDLQKAADLNQQQGETSIYQKVLNTIKQLQGMVSG
jgi:tetratricopeptide (TPR) repeat protein